MMKTLFISIFFIFSSCKNEKKNTEDQHFYPETFDCQKGEMASNWYAKGIDVSIENQTFDKEELYIIVDTTQKARNYISYYEHKLKRNADSIDTSSFSSDPDIDWYYWSNKKKEEHIKKERVKILKRAKEIHEKTNQGQQIVSIVNNSKDTVALQMQDGTYICILQAKTKKNQWCPIEYWEFSDCGNSYYLKKLPPKTKNSFIPYSTNKGDYNTKLRYKLLGQEKFYYSNEFDGVINYCQFVEDSSNYIMRKNGLMPHYTLDTLIPLVKE